ncbi:hypothetical protein LSH36_191g03068 [Paralvinella palmiformis]|uniref:Nudix hydrolase domain-containing protein n=1 Tax=Paralvinella palmiformis TaxID=53620 RepID=A0AAD9JRV9_9ANNE|nr:hypothetical protein LSH36_191g03068 [Paralvinella palmiformis]
MDNDRCFKLKRDGYSCVKIEPKVYDLLTKEELASKLSASLISWQQDGIRGVWAEVDLIHSHLIPVFVENGFDYHHAKSNYVMMKKWISQKEPDTLPPYASHYVGVGGFVLNDDNQLLVVQERFSCSPHWKLPGGHADLGENIGETAEREVYEETGIRTKFQCVVAFRHMHQFRFGCSDFYFVCLMKPLTLEINRCQYEIADARWLDLETYISNPLVSAANRHFAKCYLDMITTGEHRILPAKVTRYTNKGYDLVYSLQDRCDDELPHESETGFKL